MRRWRANRSGGYGGSLVDVPTTREIGSDVCGAGDRFRRRELGKIDAELFGALARHDFGVAVIDRGRVDAGAGLEELERSIEFGFYACEALLEVVLGHVHKLQLGSHAGVVAHSSRHAASAGEVVDNSRGVVMVTTPGVVMVTKGCGQIDHTGVVMVTTQ